MILTNVIRNITQHPLTEKRKAAAVVRFLGWQLQSRVSNKPRVVKLVNDSTLLVRRGQASASGTLYTGLLEFEDMGFLLHCLHRGDLFVDVGANVGVYTILAGKVCGAHCLSFEPVPATFACLRENLALNGLDNVEARNIGVGRERGALFFTSTRDSTNHALRPGEKAEDAISVPVETLDETVGGREPVLIKIDVEGFEAEVIAGAASVLSRPSLLAVIMELNGQGRQYGFDERALHEKMLNYGFQTFTYEPFSRRLLPPDAGTRNVLYIKDVDQVRARVSAAASFEVLDQMI